MRGEGGKRGERSRTSVRPCQEGGAEHHYMLLEARGGRKTRGKEQDLSEALPGRGCRAPLHVARGEKQSSEAEERLQRSTCSWSRGTEPCRKILKRSQREKNINKKEIEGENVFAYEVLAGRFAT